MKNNELYAWLMAAIDSGNPLVVTILGVIVGALLFRHLIINGQVLQNILQSRFTTRVERLETALASKYTDDPTKQLLKEQLGSEYASLLFKTQTSSQYRAAVAAAFESAAGDVCMRYLVRAGKYMSISDGSLMVKLTRGDKAVALFNFGSMVVMFLLFFVLLVLVWFSLFVSYDSSLVSFALMAPVAFGFALLFANDAGKFYAARQVKNYLATMQRDQSNEEDTPPS